MHWAGFGPSPELSGPPSHLFTQLGIVPDFPTFWWQKASWSFSPLSDTPFSGDGGVGGGGWNHFPQFPLAVDLVQYHCGLLGSHII